MKKICAVSHFLDITCRVKSRIVKDALHTVLTKIRARSPKDFERIRNRVRKIIPLSQKCRRQGDLGEWKSDGGKYDYASTGVILLSSDPLYLIATVAHELGHACTREPDIAKRDIDSEWASEMCADYYAYKWGFGRNIARFRPNRVASHHGPMPGHYHLTSDGMPDGVWARLRISRAFIPHLVRTETLDGQVIETAVQIEKKKRLKNKEMEKKFPIRLVRRRDRRS